MKYILLDTDISADCDDTGALAVLHSFANRGECRIIGCIVNGRDEDASAGAAVWAINAYYGRGEIPVGTYQGDAKITKSSYTLPLRKRFAPDHPDDLRLPSALDVYRRTLAAADDRSVTIVSIGFFHNLKDLIDSEPDSFSASSGVDLVRQKVKELIVMGGAFPSNLKEEPEFNFGWGGVAPLTRTVLEKWPTRIIFTGFEIGHPIITGSGLAGTPADNPVRLAYSLYGVGSKYALEAGRNSWDQTAAWLAVRGTDGLWNLSGPGVCRISEKGCNEWLPDPNGSHFYITAAAPVASVAALIETEMAATPSLPS